MSFFSFSSGRRPYRNPSHGSGHYQRRGILDKLGGLMGSFSNDHRGYYPPNGQPMGNQPMQYNNQPPAGGMFCPKCGASVPTGSKFCLQCGGEMNVQSTCGNCGQVVPANAKFCPGCGTPRR